LRNAGERTWLGLGLGLRFGLGLGLGFEFGLGVGVGEGVAVEDLDGDVADDASDDRGGGVAKGSHLVGGWGEGTIRPRASPYSEP